MSANVPLQMVPQLNALFKVQFNVVRVQNTRPNHRYRVFRTERGQMKPLVIQQVVDALRQNQKSLVFCPTVLQVESMAREIVLAAYQQDVLGAGRVQRYFSALGKDMKRQIVKQFKAGELMVVVSTSAFGVGVDIPDIRYVIHAGPSYTFLDYIQEAERGGRDGDPTLCMLYDNDLRSHQKEPAKLESLVQYCENNTFCRRQLISLECNDETGETCLEQGVEPCDVCLAGPPQQLEERVGVVPGIVELDPDAYLAAVQSRQEIVRISGSWKMAAFLMQGKCLICLHEHQENDTHMDYACPYLAGKCLFCLGPHFVAECPNKPEIRRRDGYLCSKCYVPLRVGSTATHDREGIEGGCQFFGSRVQQLMLHMQVVPLERVDEIFKVVDSLPFFYRCRPYCGP
ncbi:hypothetical protein MP228_003751 [Amoeboaphelidium protococcarum]|nr:hypothetical protein MP228_003751 [Amoeboaphelidium protococcarum]